MVFAREGWGSLRPEDAIERPWSWRAVSRDEAWRRAAREPVVVLAPSIAVNARASWFDVRSGFVRTGSAYDLRPLRYFVYVGARAESTAGGAHAGGEAREARESNAANEQAHPAETQPAQAATATAHECLLREVEVRCSHQGRSARAGEVLEVVPAESGDKLKLRARVRDACGDHPSWTISGYGSSTEQGEEASFRAMSWRAGKAWLADVVPHTYQIRAGACHGGGSTVTVKAYPSDKGTIKWDPEREFPWAKHLAEEANAFLKRYVAHAEFELLKGSVAFEYGWQEADDRRAFYKWDVKAQFDPLLAAKFRAPLGASAAIPPWLREHIGDGLYAELSGELELSAQGGRTSPDELGVTVEAGGYIRGKIGVEVALASKDVLSVEVSGGTGIGVSAEWEAKLERPSVKVEMKWEGIKGTVSLSAFFGHLAYEREFTIVDECTLLERTYGLLGEGAAHAEG